MVRGHVQMGLWFLVVQMARMPQVCRQGSTHFLFTQALSGAHSALTTHSGLQLGGWLMKPVDISALAVGSAGRWGTGLNYRVLHDGFHTTVYERITLVALHA